MEKEKKISEEIEFKYIGKRSQSQSAETEEKESK